MMNGTIACGDGGEGHADDRTTGMMTMVKGTVLILVMMLMMMMLSG